MKKRLIALLLVIVLFSALPLTTFASAPADIWSVQPRYAVIKSLSASLTGQSGYVTASGKVTVTDPALTCNLTLELQKKENGSWITIATWYNSGAISVSVSNTYYLQSGQYRTKVTARVYNASNVLVETAYAYYP